MIRKFSGEVEAVKPVACADTWRSRAAADLRVLRGGSWNNNDQSNLLSSNRNNNDPGNRNNNNGFRVVVVAGSGGKATALKDRRDAGWLPWLPGQWQEVSLTRRPAPRKKHSADGDGSRPVPGIRRSACPWSRPAGSRVFLFRGLEPCPGHAPDLIQLLRGKEQLALADPLPGLHETPEHATLFQHEVERAQFRRAGPGIVARGHGVLHGGQHEQIHSLAKGEAVGFGKVCRAIERPAEKFLNDGKNGRR